MTDLEISRALALAIGWKTEDIAMGATAVWVRDPHGKFDYRDWSVAGPIAEKFDAFPMRSCVPGEWHSTFDGNDMSMVYADTPQKAIALAVINGSKK